MLERLPRILFGGGFVLVGLLQLVWCVYASGMAIRASTWPTANGVIETAAVRHGPRNATIPTVTFRYSVAGQEYRGNRISYYGDLGETSGRAAGIVAKYPPGSLIPVHYCPEDPGQSLLEPGLNLYSFVWLALSMAGVAVGTLAIRWNKP